MKVKFILPALTEAKSPYWRPIKYSLFPPLGLATLAGYLSKEDEVDLQDEHVESLNLDDTPDLVAIEVYITNAYRAYEMADLYRKKGAFVILGGLHVTALPEEAEKHADAIFLGPAEESFPRFLSDFKHRQTKKRYRSTTRTLHGIPKMRRDLIKRELYLVPNSIIVSRGCPHHCDFCYKDSFFANGKSFYTSRVDEALCEIESLPGRHLYFLDDHLFGNPKFATQLFDGLMGMNRVFQGAATVESILRGNLIEKAADAGLRSLFVGFETLGQKNLCTNNKKHNLIQDYQQAVQKLHNLGIMINASFVFGLDDDDDDVFKSTVDWALENGITTSTFHILTPYPGTRLFQSLEQAGRITTRNWDLYDTRHVVFKTKKISPRKLKEGYDFAYREFYHWSSIFKASFYHDNSKHIIKHLAYTVGWKKFEPFWNFIIKAKILGYTRPLLEVVLSKMNSSKKNIKINDLKVINGLGANQ